MPTELTREERAFLRRCTGEEVRAYELIKDVVARFKIGFPFATWQMQLIVAPSRHGPEAILTVTWWAPHCTTGMPVQLNEDHRLHLLTVDQFQDGIGQLQCLILDLLRQAILHELMESVMFDGARLEDPHAGASFRNAPTGSLDTVPRAT